MMASGAKATSVKRVRTISNDQNIIAARNVAVFRDRSTEPENTYQGNSALMRGNNNANSQTKTQFSINQQAAMAPQHHQQLADLKSNKVVSIQVNLNDS